jgi:hypothetical protein
LHDKNAAGTVATTVVPASATTNQFVTGLLPTGVLLKAQPAFSNLNADGVLVLATGTSSVAPLNVPAGTLKTTPAAGDIEADSTNVYGTTDAGNRGYIPFIHMIREDSDLTLANSASAQNIFATPTNGRITLATGTYRFRALLGVTTMNAASGNAKIDVLGGGTAIVANWLWHAWGEDQGSASTGVSTGGSWQFTNASAVNIITPTVQTAMGVSIDGTFEISGAGTIQPQITLQSASAAVIKGGSYFEFWRVGDQTRTSVGKWD